MRFALLGCLLAATAYAQSFVPFLPDIPVPDGAYSESLLDFDTEDTHLEQVMIYSPLSVDKTWQFYADTLPQLGWQANGPSRFVKDEDTLALEVIESKDGKGVFLLELKTANKNP